MTIGDWITALVAVVALGLSIYNTYTQRRDRIPRVKIGGRWNHSSDITPEAMKGPMHPATAPPGKVIFECDITNVGVVGVKIKEVYVYIHAPPGRGIPLHLPEGEQSRRLDSGDSQTWSETFPHSLVWRQQDYDPHAVGTGDWIRVIAWDTAGNMHEKKNPDFVPPPPYTG